MQNIRVQYEVFHTRNIIAMYSITGYAHGMVWGCVQHNGIQTQNIVGSEGHVI